MSLITKREFLVRDKVFSVSGKKAISDPNTKEEIGFFKSRAIQLAKKFRLSDLDLWITPSIRGNIWEN